MGTNINKKKNLNFFYFHKRLHSYAALKNCDEVLIKRARHVITEIQRTYEAAEALKGHNFVQVTEREYNLHDIFFCVCVVHHFATLTLFYLI